VITSTANALPADTARAGMPVGVFSASVLAKTEHFPIFIGALQGHSGLDLRYLHAPATSIRIASAGLQQDVTSFGVRNAKILQHFKDGFYKMRETESVILHNAIYSPRSATITKVGLGLYDESIRNHLLIEDGLRVMTQMDPLFRMDDRGQCCFGAEVESLEYSNDIAVPVCGTGYPNYGHFLYDGLPAILMLASMLDAPRFCIVGPPMLRPWQREILAALNLLRFHRSLPRPVMFRKVVTSSLISLHVPYPTRFVRPVFDMLRFRFGGERRDARMLFVSRSFDTAKRALTNRAEVEALFRDQGFEIVNPERHSVADQVRMFASAAIVAGESGAGLANIGFCDPGAKVLEIQPDLFFEGWTRAACMIFGHRWHVFCAESRPTEEPDPSFGAAAKLLTFTADLAALRTAIDTVRRG
jgi:hypothetical protein